MPRGRLLTEKIAGEKTGNDLVTARSKSRRVIKWSPGVNQKDSMSDVEKNKQFLLCFAVLVIEQSVTTGQIAERRWTANDVARELGMSITTQWRWRKEGLLSFVQVGPKFYYKTSHLLDAGLL